MDISYIRGTVMDYSAPIRALSFTFLVALAVDIQTIEVGAKIFMYFSAGLVSLVTVYYLIKNKGRKQ